MAVRAHGQGVLHLLHTTILLLFTATFLDHYTDVVAPANNPHSALPPIVLGVAPSGFSIGQPAIRRRGVCVRFSRFIRLGSRRGRFFASPRVGGGPLISVHNGNVIIRLHSALRTGAACTLGFNDTIHSGGRNGPLCSVHCIFSAKPAVSSVVFSNCATSDCGTSSISGSFV